MVFFDLKYSKESEKEASKSNRDEANFIMQLFEDLIKLILRSVEQSSLPPNVNTHNEKMKFILNDLKSRIGIISPYKSQVKALKDLFYPYLRKFNCPINMIEINTVDAY